MSLRTPSETVEKLQTSLQTKAKAEPAFRFYALWDKVCRKDVLLEAYRRCRANAGASGVDNETFERIDTHGLERWLETLWEELSSGKYVPKPLLRVWIPKSNGGQRPLGIPCIRDRVVQMAAVLVIGPIFEVDLLPQQHGFRPGLDAKMALRRVYWHVTQHGRREVVDADLRDYFNSIPHAPLMRSLSRRIADRRILHVIKRWLSAPVVEVIDGRSVQTAEARRTKRGTPQGGVISPLLANCYFRRFLLAWHDHGHRDRLDAHVVNYADDFVICCRPGNASAAMARMATLMTRLGLEVNAKKTRIARLPEESFDFLGYTVGRFHGKKNGRPYIGTRPSRKSVKSLLRRIHQRTTRRWYADDPKSTVARISSMLRGWCGYFDQGPVITIYDLIHRYTERRIRRWLLRRSGRKGAGFDQIPDEYLYETLGLYTGRVATITLDGVLVGADARLEGGAATIEEVVDIGRAVISAALCGVAEEAFARTARYLKERRQFDRRIGSFQALQHRTACVHIEIENAWSATLQALQSIEACANSAAFDVAIAKAKASETACAVTAECLQMHGGIGMTDEFDIGLFLKRARVNSVLFGDAAFHTDRVATMLGY